MGNLRHSFFLNLALIGIVAGSNGARAEGEVQARACVGLYKEIDELYTAQEELKKPYTPKEPIKVKIPRSGSATIVDDSSKNEAVAKLDDAKIEIFSELAAEHGKVNQKVVSLQSALGSVRTANESGDKSLKGANSDLGDAARYSKLLQASPLMSSASSCVSSALQAGSEKRSCNGEATTGHASAEIVIELSKECVTAAAKYKQDRTEIAHSGSEFKKIKESVKQIDSQQSKDNFEYYIKKCEKDASDSGVLAAQCGQMQNYAQNMGGQMMPQDSQQEQQQPKDQQSGNGQPPTQQQAGAGTPEKEKPKANEPKVPSEDATKVASDKAEAAAKAEAERIAALNASGFVECTDPANPTGPKQKVSKAFGCTSDAVAAAANVINSGTAANLTPDASTPSVPSKNPNSLTSGNPAVAALPADSATVGGGRALASGNSSSRSLGGSLSSGRSLFGGSNFNMNGLGSSGKADAGKEGAVTNANMLFTKGLNCAKPEHLNKKQKLACDRQKSILKTTDVSTDVSADTRYQSLEK